MTSIAELYALQEADLALDARRAALADVESRLGEPDERGEIEAAVEERQQAFRAAERTFREREQEADELRSKIEPLEKKLYRGGVNNPKELEDLQRDIESIQRRRSELEDRALEAMDALETATSALGEAKRELAELDARLGTEQRELQQQKGSFAAEIAALESEREERAAAVDAGLMRLYDELQARRQRRAVVRVVGGACQGCRISLPVNVLQRARGGGLVQCSSCERILYVT